MSEPRGGAAVKPVREAPLRLGGPAHADPLDVLEADLETKGDGLALRALVAIRGLRRTIADLTDVVARKRADYEGLASAAEPFLED